jgi:hypothetical protein
VAVRYFDNKNNFMSQAVLWQSDAYQNPQSAIHSGSFTVPAGATSFRLGLTAPLMDGRLAYEGIVLTGRSQSIAIMADDNYQLTLQLAGNLPAAQAARILAHFDTEEIVELWHNPANYQSGGAAHTLPFTAAATATSVQFQYQATTVVGPFASSLNAYLVNTNHSGCHVPAARSKNDRS